MPNFDRVEGHSKPVAKHYEVSRGTTTHQPKPPVPSGHTKPLKLAIGPIFTPFRSEDLGFRPLLAPSALGLKQASNQYPDGYICLVCDNLANY